MKSIYLVVSVILMSGDIAPHTKATHGYKVKNIFDSVEVDTVPKPKKHHHGWWDETPKASPVKNTFKDVPPTRDNSRMTTKHDYVISDPLERMHESKTDGQQHKSDFRDDIPAQSSLSIHQTNVGKGEETKGAKASSQGTRVLKSLTKKHFYFQAQPVRPEDEEERTSETIYYIDF